VTQARQYADWVLHPDNAIKTGRLIKLSASRFLSDLDREDIYFDPEEAVFMVNFIEEECNQWEGKWRGKPLKLEGWQRFIIEQIYGWIRKDTGCRRFNRVYIQVAKKNGKSSICAGLGLGHIYADDRVQTPKVFTAANNEDQAKICVNMAGRMIEQSPNLFDYVEDGTIRLFNYKDNITEIVHTEKDGFIKALSKESSDKQSKTAGGKHGINASLGLVDEFGMSPDYGASGTIESSMASRDEWLMLFFTTAGFNLSGPCYTELRDLGVKVLEGVIKMDNYLPIIYEIDPPVNDDGKTEKITAQWLLDNPDVWVQSNPNLGISVNPAFLQTQLEKAIQKRGTLEVEVKTLNFNEWCEGLEVWVPTETWAKNTFGWEEDRLIGRTCYGGIELTSGRNINALSLYFPDVEEGKNAVKVFIWMPEEILKDDLLRTVLQPWVELGLIEVCPGNVIDNDYIFNKILDIFRLYNVHSIAHNKVHENHDIVQALVRQGITFNPINSGYSGQNTPTKLWEALLTGVKIEHFGNPVLSWMNTKTMVTRNKDQEIRIQKSEGFTCGITASVNALAQYKAIVAQEGGDDGKIDSW
jgi:phage terminase large subunit-like protein